MALKRPYPGYSEGQFPHSQGGSQKRPYTRPNMYGPITVPVSSFNNYNINNNNKSHQLFPEQSFGNDESFLAGTVDETNGLNPCLLPYQNNQHHSRTSDPSQMDPAQFQILVGNVFSQMQDRRRHFDDNKARQSPFTELDQHGPWTPFDMGGDKAGRPNVSSLQTSWDQPEHNQLSLQNSQITYACMGNAHAAHDTPSDSGYETVPHKSPPLHSTEQSMYGGDTLTTIQDCSTLTNDINDVPFQHGLDFDFGPFPHTTQSAPFPESKPGVSVEVTLDPPPENGPFLCKICYQTGDLNLANLKNKSEWKKHTLRHTKPYRCTWPMCKRGGAGFSTQNDLDRHRKSVHQTLPMKGTTDRTYICAAPNCTKRDKIWPRADNFKQHCERLHKKQGLDVDELMAKSWIRLPPKHVSFGGPVPLPVSSAPSPSPCQTEYSPQSAHITHLANAQDAAAATSFVPSTSAGANAGEKIDRHSSTLRAGSSPNTTARPDALHRKSVSQFVDGNTDVVENTMQTDTSVYNHLREVCKQGDPFMRPQRPQNPLPSTRVLRSCKTAMPLTKRLAAPRKAAIHDAETPPVTDRMHAAVPHMDTTTDAPPFPDRHNHLDEPGRLKAKGVKQSLKDELIKAMKMEACDSKDIKLTESLDAIIEKFVKAEPGADMTATKEGETEEGIRAMKRSPLKCPKCDKYKQSTSDLKKHEKRHSRPYGCTHHGCHKKFGSKNDWKRHENTMHFQVECWRCDEPVPTAPHQQHSKDRSYPHDVNAATSHDEVMSVDITTNTIFPPQSLTHRSCATVFYRKEDFTAHLKQAHHIAAPADLKKRKKACHIGRNGQGSFWCGFCKRIVPLTHQGFEAWDEKFDHIDNLHYKEGWEIEAWREMNGVIKGCRLGDWYGEGGKRGRRMARRDGKGKGDGDLGVFDEEEEDDDDDDDGDAPQEEEEEEEGEGEEEEEEEKEAEDDDHEITGSHANIYSHNANSGERQHDESSIPLVISVDNYTSPERLHQQKQLGSPNSLKASSSHRSYPDAIPKPGILNLTRTCPPTDDLPGITIVEEERHPSPVGPQQPRGGGEGPSRQPDLVSTLNSSSSSTEPAMLMGSRSQDTSRPQERPPGHEAIPSSMSSSPDEPRVKVKVCATAKKDPTPATSTTTASPVGHAAMGIGGAGAVR